MSRRPRRNHSAEFKAKVRSGSGNLNRGISGIAA